MRLVALGLLLTSAASGAEPPITALAFAPDGRTLVAGSSGGIVERSWPDLRPLRPIPTRLRQVHDLAFAPDGGTLLAAGGSPGRAGEVERFDWPGGRPVGFDAPHDDLIHAVAWRGDGRAFATASADGLVLVHAVEGGDPLPLEGHSRGVLAVGFAGDALATAGLDQSLRVWDAATGRLLRSLNQHAGPVTGLATRPGIPRGGLPMIATIGLDRTARLWQPTIGRMVRLARVESPPLAVAWIEGGARLAVACTDGKVRIIDPDTVAVLRTLPALDGWAHSLAASPSGDAVAVGGEGGRVVRIDLGP